MKKNNALTNL
jgi:hypothetical protein